jgi:hypothetical protein
VLLIEPFLKTLIDEGDSHEATNLLSVLPQYQTGLVLYQDLIVVKSGSHHEPTLFHKVHILLLRVNVSEICSCSSKVLENFDQTDIRVTLVI